MGVEDELARLERDDIERERARIAARGGRREVAERMVCAMAQLRQQGGHLLAKKTTTITKTDRRGRTSREPTEGPVKWTAFADDFGLELFSDGRIYGFSSSGAGATYENADEFIAAFSEGVDPRWAHATTPRLNRPWAEAAKALEADVAKSIHVVLKEMRSKRQELIDQARRAPEQHLRRLDLRRHKRYSRGDGKRVYRNVFVIHEFSPGGDGVSTPGAAVSSDLRWVVGFSGERDPGGGRWQYFWTDATALGSLEAELL